MYRKDETIFFYSIETAFKPFMVRQHAGMAHHETWTAYEKNYIDTWLYPFLNALTVEFKKFNLMVKEVRPVR